LKLVDPSFKSVLINTISNTDTEDQELLKGFENEMWEIISENNNFKYVYINNDDQIKTEKDLNDNYSDIQYSNQ